MFCAAQGFDGIEIDEALVCDSVSWLLENQRQDGAFPEVKDIIHKSMMVSFLSHVNCDDHQINCDDHLLLSLLDIVAFVRRP